MIHINSATKWYWFCDWCRFCNVCIGLVTVVLFNPEEPFICSAVAKLAIHSPLSIRDNYVPNFYSVSYTYKKSLIKNM